MKKKIEVLFFILLGITSNFLDAQTTNSLWEGLLTNIALFGAQGTNRTNSLLHHPITNLIPVTNFHITNVEEYSIVSNQSVAQKRVLTNEVITNQIQVYQFFDVYPTLIDVTPEMLQEDPAEKITEILFPSEDLTFTNTEIPWKKKLRLKKIRFISDAILDSFPEEQFKQLIWQKKFNKLALTPEEKMHLTFGFEKWETKVIISGYVDIRSGYGWSFKDENNPSGVPGISQGFQINQEMKVNVTGKVGKRINVSINHDSTKQENSYEIGYHALDKDLGVIRELRAGNITLNLPDRSRFVKYGGTSKDSYGLKLGASYGDFDLQTILNVTTSLKGHKSFTGRQRSVQVQISDINYIKRKYFQLPDISIDLNSVLVYRQVSDVNLSDKQIGGFYYRVLLSGVDYYLNAQTGSLELASSLARNDNLLIRYTTGGQDFSTNTNTVVVNDAGGNSYFYLWKSDWNDSPYVHDGYYSIGVRNFDPTLGFNLAVYLSSDSSTLADIQFTTEDYQINPISGYIRFNSLRPFTNNYTNLYATPYDPSSSDSHYVMKLTLNSKVDSYQLDFGIIPGTEKVLVNGRELNKSEYTLIYSIGELIFNNKNLINANDKIEVTYEYKPFWGGSQKYGFASRLDWKPSKMINLGGTLVYNLSQRQVASPSIGNTPDGLLMMDLDGNINFAELFKLPSAIKLSLSGEYAFSSYDPNTVGYALVDDFEGVGQNMSLSKNENRWILAAPPSGISGVSYTNRGDLIYRDYRSYNLDHSFTLLNYASTLSSSKIKLYGEKPGPYLVSGGHLNAADYPSLLQTSLAFDYNFLNGDWVGAAYSLAGPAGMDFSEYNEVSFWVRMENDEDGDNVFSTEGSNKVELYLILGGLNEDSDGDGVLDKEETTSDSGYAFNDFVNHAVVKTHVGSGRLGQGDGYIQTEDLNRDGVLQTNNSVVIYPSTFTDPGTVVVSDGDWHKVSFSIRSLDNNARNILQHVSSLGVIIKKQNGTRGRLLIDSLEFKKVQWEEKKVDHQLVISSQRIQGDGISVYNNPYYNQHKFYIVGSDDTNADDRANVFEKLHGTRTIVEANQLNESSLRLHYDLTNILYNTNFGIGGTRATLIKRNSYPMDFSAYRYLNFYLYVPSEDENGSPIKSGGDQYENESFVFVLGNTENRYYEWTVPMNRLDKDTWIPVSIAFDDGMSLKINGVADEAWKQPQKVGMPNIRDVNRIEIGVELNQTNEALNVGDIWIDEMYASSDISRFGTAYYANPIFEYNKPLWSPGGFEVIGPLHIHSTVQGRDKNFKGGNTVNRLQSDWSGNLDAGIKLFKNLNLQLTYNRSENKSSTNEIEMPLYQQWANLSELTKMAWSYQSRKWIPQLSHTYTERYTSHFDRSLFSVLSNDQTVQKDQDDYQSTASFGWNQLLPVLPSLTISPSFNLADTYSLLSKDQFTNLISPVYLSNQDAYGSETLNKELKGRLQVNWLRLQLIGSYTRQNERYNKIFSDRSYRALMLTQKSNQIFSRYLDRLKSLGEGFYYTNQPFESQQADIANLNLRLDKPIKFFSFSRADSLTRQRSGYTYDVNGTLNSKYDQYEFKSQNTMYLYPKFLIFDTLMFQTERSLTYNYRTADYTLDLTNTLPFAAIYYQQPLYYSALFTGDFARTNALSLMAYLSDGQYQSYSSLNDKLSFEWTLPNFQPKWTYLIPKKYVFSTQLSTSRNLSSYYQSLQNIISTSFPLKFSMLVKRDKDFRLGDMNISLLYKNFLNFNSRKNQHEFSSSLNETVWLSKTINFNLFYQFSLKNELDYTNYSAYESSYGMLANTGDSPYSQWNHNLNFSFNWVIRDIKDFKLWGMNFSMKGTTINNKETLTFVRNTKEMQSVRFSPYTDKDYEFTLIHNTQYQFSKFVTGSLSLKGVMNQLTDIYVSGTQIARNSYKPGFGFQFNVNMRIKF